MAGLELTASAILGVTSPIMALAMIMDKGPTMASTDWLVRTMAFSPVAPRFAPAFIIRKVAAELVPKARISRSFPRDSLMALMKAAPIPPPCPSIIISRTASLPLVPCA